jgi:hypothetical protein
VPRLARARAARRRGAAHLDADGLVVALPAALSGTVRVALAVERSEISYGDDACVAGG